jgi:hypothetical protein
MSKAERTKGALAAFTFNDVIPVLVTMPISLSWDAFHVRIERFLYRGNRIYSTIHKDGSMCAACFQPDL